MKLPLTIYLLFLVYNCFGQQSVLNVNYMLRGHIYVKSSTEDPKAFGGFGGSDNAAKKISETSGLEQAGLFLLVDTTQAVPFAKEYKGYKLFIVNRSKTTKQFHASDSRLKAVAQAYIDHKWQAIEYLPSSWCGNSFHRVFLQANEYWELSVPLFEGEIATKVRYQLEKEDGTFSYSNAFSCSVNRAQLTEKQGYAPNGMMDPYND